MLRGLPRRRRRSETLCREERVSAMLHLLAAVKNGRGDIHRSLSRLPGHNNGNNKTLHNLYATARLYVPLSRVACTALPGAETTCCICYIVDSSYMAIERVTS